MTGKPFHLLAEKTFEGWSNCNLLVYGNVLMFFFGKKFRILYPLLTLSKNVLDIGKRISAIMRKQNSTCPEEHFEEFLSGKWTCALLPFPDFEQKTFGFSAKVPSRLIETAFNSSRRMFRGFSREIYISRRYFRTLSEKYNQLFDGKFVVGFWNCYKSRGKNLGEIYFLWNL